MAATTYDIAAARNPRWVDHNHNMIDLEVDFVPLDEDWLKYTCSPTDVCAHSRELYTRAANGEFGTIADELTPTTGDFWTPQYATQTRVCVESFVQLLLEKGVITDEDVDTILVEDKDVFIAYTKPTMDGSNPVYHSPMGLT